MPAQTSPSTQPPTQHKPFRRPHGTLLQLASRKGKPIRIPCPRCNRLTTQRYWHADLGIGICERCWDYLTRNSRPMALTKEK